jgi:hypothetical protein
VGGTIFEGLTFAGMVKGKQEIKGRFMARIGPVIENPKGVCVHCHVLGKTSCMVP